MRMGRKNAHGGDQPDLEHGDAKKEPGNMIQGLEELMLKRKLCNRIIFERILFLSVPLEKGGQICLDFG